MNKVEKQDNLAAYLFHQGTNFAAYEYMGAHCDGEDVVFRTWAPSATAVSVVGDFNHWQRGRHAMERITEKGVWECRVQNVTEFDSYKYCITDRFGNVKEKSDPYAFHCETRPLTASKVYDIDKNFNWTDDEWMQKRAKSNIYTSPVNIFELNACSWKTHFDGNFYDYEYLGDKLVEYVTMMGYTHVEFMPLMEFPFDLSWGYQVTGYFAATSRFGTPDMLMSMINKLHGAGIGVILDWVPAHFPKDDFALNRFDGEYCYEYAHNQKRENPDWGTHQFDYGKQEVESFLVSGASFWFDKYHIDGLRVDAVAAMLYLDYSRRDGQWEPNGYGGNTNLEAVALFKKLNAHLFGMFPGIMMIAEESTSWPKVTMPVHEDGLGFNYKWNMGWMNDVLRYFETPTVYRKYHHDWLTNTFLYAYSENYILPISHDEVVYGKGSLLNKMPGDYWQKFANLRLFLCFMMAYPGKKLLFMGSEFGQFSEWDCQKELDWQVLDYESHSKTQSFTRDLNRFYLATPALYSDENYTGLQWICHSDNEQQLITFVRKSGQENVIVALNMSPAVHHGYKLKVPAAGTYEEIFNSDLEMYMGSNLYNPPSKAVKTEEGYEIEVTLPPLAGVFFKKQAAQRKKAQTESK